MGPGTELKRGTFVITSELGRGGFGAVYLARQPKMRRDVAIKVLLERVAENPEVVVRFQREALAAASLSHPHVLPVFDFDFDEEVGVWFLAMQYVPGGRTLKHQLIRPLDPVEAVPILQAVADALDAAHQRGIIHRDVKPANVLLDGDRPILTDFGIAHLGTVTEMTASGIAMGTPTYMPPEQALGKEVGPRTDQYSLAIMAYEMLAGRPPFVGERMSVMFHHVNTDPPSLRDFNPAISEEIQSVLARGMRKEPAERFSSCSELVDALRAAGGLEVSPTSSRAAAVESAPPTEAYVGIGAGVAAEPAEGAGSAAAGWSRIDALRADQAAVRKGFRLPGPALVGGAALLTALVVAGAAIAFTLSQSSRPSAGEGSAGGTQAALAAQPAPDEASSGRQAAALSALTITSSPDGAAILVNGEAAGRTPRLVRVPPGEHDLTLVLPSYQDWTRRVQLLEGQQLSIPADLAPLPAPQVLEITDQRLGRDPFLDANSIIRLGAFTDTFEVSDDVNAVVYLRPRTHAIRDLSFTTVHRWERAGAEPIELSGLQQVSKDWEQTFLRACAPALALDVRGSGIPLGLEIFIDGESVASFSFRVSGGNPANAPPSACDASAVPVRSV